MVHLGRTFNQPFRHENSHNEGHDADGAFSETDGHFIGFRPLIPRKYIHTSADEVDHPQRNKITEWQTRADYCAPPHPQNHCRSKNKADGQAKDQIG
jgi:hypothetical protein